MRKKWKKQKCKFKIHCDIISHLSYWHNFMLAMCSVGEVVGKQALSYIVCGNVKFYNVNRAEVNIYWNYICLYSLTQYPYFQEFILMTNLQYKYINILLIFGNYLRAQTFSYKWVNYISRELCSCKWNEDNRWINKECFLWTVLKKRVHMLLFMYYRQGNMHIFA